MLTSIALILLTGMLSGRICKALRLPSLLGMLFAGIILGPCVLDLIDGQMFDISAQIRKIALIIILTRAGLTLNTADLKKVGRPAILMCFVPALFEICGMLLLAPALLHISLLEAAVLGTVIGAVSPAVIVPKMIKLTEEGYGTDQGIPQLILAGASADDVFVIVLFSSFMGLAQGKEISPLSLINIPVSIILGTAAGIIIGYMLSKLFTKFHMRDTVKLMIWLSISFLLSSAEDSLSAVSAITFSSLIAVMFSGTAMQKFCPEASKRLSGKLNRIWVWTEIFLFVLVGAAVDIRRIPEAGLAMLILLTGVICFRMAGVFICMLGTKLNMKERLFCMLAYTPKATVQAAIGGAPLAAGLACGDTVLTAAVLAIMVTAPMGAFAIDISYKRLLAPKKT